jgi:glycosyltransferase involved in cell wall biosynthesis
MLSIIIPAFNEERFLPILLDSIKRQEVACELIVADHISTDKTLDIAENYRCKIVDGGSPAKARNSGAKAACHDLLFVDADVVMPDNFLKRFMDKISRAQLGYASCRVEPCSDNPHHRFVYTLKNIGNLSFANHVSGQCLFVKKDLFEKAGGFDESLFLGEEHELAQRLSKCGKGDFFMDLYVLNFPRRHELEGTYKTLLKDIYSEAYRMVNGPLRHELYKKRYGHY